ncbi:MAG TPA: DUF6691 family protein [Gemmatimonadaceae bacterium]|nr:DUF6691 family protein [Gemmatimonadaceae bacterium]
MSTVQQPIPTARLSGAPVAHAQNGALAREVATYLAVGVLFGIVIVKAQVVSWYRIQEMFRFQSFHMYGILGSAMLTALVWVQLLRRLGARTRTGDRIVIAPKVLGRGHRYWIGGLIFGAGWALTGACPGPLFALVGTGATVFLAVAIAALAGTWTYGYMRPRLP